MHSIVYFAQNAYRPPLNRRTQKTSFKKHCCKVVPSDLLKSRRADMKLLHWPRLHWSADQSVTLVTQLPMLED